MMSSGSTVLRFDFDIFSIGPILTNFPLYLASRFPFGLVRNLILDGTIQPSLLVL